jgi:heat shock protein HtpX
VSTLLTRTLSRYRELAADSTGAMLTGQPSTMASALIKVHEDVAMIPAADMRAHQALGAVTVVGVRGPLGVLTSTHPSLQKRLDNLAKVAERLGQPSPSD